MDASNKRLILSLVREHFLEYINTKNEVINKIVKFIEAYKLDKDYREVLTKASELRSMRNRLSKEIGQFMREGNKEAAENNKKQVNEMADELKQLEEE